MKKNIPNDYLHFFYDDSVEDYESKYFIEFNYEFENIAISSTEFSFSLQQNGSIMLYFQSSINDSSKISELAGLVYPQYNERGVFGNITFFNDDLKNIYENYRHTTIFYPIGHFIYNFDTNSYDEFVMSGLNLVLEI